MIAYMTIKNNKNAYSYINKYKESSIKIGKNGVNDTRYIWGFEYITGNEISLLKNYKISDDLIDLYLDLRKDRTVPISELGIGFDDDNEIKKVYYLDEGKTYGFGVKSDGKNVVYSQYTHKNTLREDLQKYMFNEYDTNFIINTLLLQPDVK